LTESLVRSDRLDYRAAGVDIEAKSRTLSALAPVIERTHSSAVSAGMGAFAGSVRVPGGGLLAATVDGVGTKTIIARALGRDTVVGADIVAHCANDLAAGGARPLAFLDYIAMSRLDAAVVSSLIEGMSGACESLGIPLLGGETAEMPSVYAGDAYDVVGTMIGFIAPDLDRSRPAGTPDRSRRSLTGERIVPGDRVIGLASTGLHTNGYSLARAVLERSGARLTDAAPGLGTTLGDALMAPHRCYVPAVLDIADRRDVRGIAHITGGGIVDNLVRVLPGGCRALIVQRWPVPPIFGWIQRNGDLAEAEMLRAFNMGVGMAVVVAANDFDTVRSDLEAAGIPAFDIGRIASGERGVEVA
jgi:phosphoribosylformylglycinamidine cyclo-ligase